MIYTEAIAGRRPDAVGAIFQNIPDVLGRQTIWFAVGDPDSVMHAIDAGIGSHPQRSVVHSLGDSWHQMAGQFRPSMAVVGQQVLPARRQNRLTVLGLAYVTEGKSATLGKSILRFEPLEVSLPQDPRAIVSAEEELSRAAFQKPTQRP